MGSSERHTSLESLERRREDERGDAVKIWNHIQLVMKGNRIIFVPLGLRFAEEY
jgi:hypothetical protein